MRRLLHPGLTQDGLWRATLFPKVLVFAAEERMADVLPLQLDGHPTYLWALVALVATLHVAAFCYWVLA